MGIVTGVGFPGAMSSASGGKIYAYNNMTEFGSVVVAPRNSQRQRIIFHNPGQNDIYIAPGSIQNTLNALPSDSNGVPLLTNHILALSNAALGGAFIVYGNGGMLEIKGECQGFWQAISKTGAGVGNPLTIMDSNN